MKQRHKSVFVQGLWDKMKIGDTLKFILRYCHKMLIIHVRVINQYEFQKQGIVQTRTLNKI